MPVHLHPPIARAHRARTIPVASSSSPPPAHLPCISTRAHGCAAGGRLPVRHHHLSRIPPLLLLLRHHAHVCNLIAFMPLPRLLPHHCTTRHVATLHAPRTPLAHPRSPTCTYRPARTFHSHRYTMLHTYLPHLQHFHAHAHPRCAARRTAACPHRPACLPACRAAGPTARVLPTPVLPLVFVPTPPPQLFAVVPVVLRAFCCCSTYRRPVGPRAPPGEDVVGLVVGAAPPRLAGGRLPALVGDDSNSAAVIVVVLCSSSLLPWCSLFWPVVVHGHGVVVVPSIPVPPAACVLPAPAACTCPTQHLCPTYAPRTRAVLVFGILPRAPACLDVGGVFGGVFPGGHGFCSW